MKNFGNLLLACMAALLGACAGESAGKCDAVVRIDADSVVNRGYIGNGVQWDPYALDYGQGRVEISDADWEKLYARLDFMRPAFIRVMTNTTSVVRDGRLDRMRGFEQLSHILGYCQSRSVTPGPGRSTARCWTTPRPMSPGWSAKRAMTASVTTTSSTNPTASGRRPTAISTCGRRP